MDGSGLSFAVIIPVYNGRAFISKAIESCLQQTVLPDEIIIIDDASNDDTADIIRSFNSALIRYERNEKNKGPSFSRNRGMQFASSSWILFLDADDIFHKSKIGVIKSCLDNNTGIKAIGHGFTVNEMAWVGNMDIFWKKLLTPEPLTIFKILLRNRIVTPSLGVAASNHIFFDETMKHAEDHDFILRTAEQFGAWYIDIPLCSLHRIPLTAGGLSSQRWEMRKGEIRMFMKYCKRERQYLLMPLLILFSLSKYIRNRLLF